jgi:hypothetical protein
MQRAYGRADQDCQGESQLFVAAFAVTRVHHSVMLLSIDHLLGKAQTRRHQAGGEHSHELVLLGIGLRQRNGCCVERGRGGAYHKALGLKPDLMGVERH